MPALPSDPVAGDVEHPCPVTQLGYHGDRQQKDDHGQHPLHRQENRVRRHESIIATGAGRHEVAPFVETSRERRVRVVDA